MNTSSNLFALSAITMACAMAMSGMAQAAEAEQAKDQKVHQLQAVQVDEAYERTGEIKITEAELKMQPSANHSINDAFRAESSVQFDINSRNGMTGAEITPPQISIRGARPFESSFLINGVSNNNNMSVNGWAHSSSSENGTNPVNGDIQGVMITTDLVDNVKLLSENVSAEYGDFTGGVVDAQIRDARADRWHIKAWVRHTRDSWSNQHLTESQEDIDKPKIESAAFQKEFKKSTVGVTLDGPLMDGKLGALVSYQKVHSSTPIWQDNGLSDPKYWDRRKSTRDMDNFILRLNTDPANDFYASTTVMYAPYEAEMFAKGTKGNSYTHEGGGWNVSINTRANLSFGTWTNDLGWNQFEATVDGPKDIYRLWPGTADWAPEKNNNKFFIPNIGGWGSQERTQDTVNFKSILALNPIFIGQTQHSFRGGIDIIFRNMKEEGSGFTDYQLTADKDNPNLEVIDGWLVPGHTGSMDGVYGDTVYKTKKVYDATNNTESYLTAAIFLEDTIKYDRFTIRPGVRVSYDDVTYDVNIAPRFKFDADILDDGLLHLNAGYNRYYGSQVCDYALRTMRSYRIYTRNAPDGNVVPEFNEPEAPKADSRNIYRLEDIKNPYSDEFVLGASTRVWDTKISLQGVLRKYEDQLQTKRLTKEAYLGTQKDVLTMTNRGESEYKGITLNLEKSYDLGAFGHHISEFGVTWSELYNNSRFTGLENSRPEDDLGWAGKSFNMEKVRLDGKLIAYDDIPAMNFNSEWVVTYNHTASFMDDRLRSTLWLRWESPADRLFETFNFNDKDADGNIYRNYKTEQNEELFNADLSLAYDLIKTANSTLTINMDVTNLFDNKQFVNTGTVNATGTPSYSMGRQFFLGMSYEY